MILEASAESFNIPSMGLEVASIQGPPFCEGLDGF